MTDYTNEEMMTKKAEFNAETPENDTLSAVKKPYRLRWISHLSGIVCAGLLIILIILTCDMINLMKEVRGNMSRVTEEFEQYVKKDIQFAEEVRDKLNGLDYERLNEAFSKMDRLDGIDIGEMEEAVHLLNGMNIGIFEQAAELINSLDTNNADEAFKNMNSVSLSDIHRQISEIQATVDQINGTLQPARDIGDGANNVITGAGQILDTINPFRNSN